MRFEVFSEHVHEGTRVYLINKVYKLVYTASILALANLVYFFLAKEEKIQRVLKFMTTASTLFSTSVSCIDTLVDSTVGGLFSRGEELEIVDRDSGLFGLLLTLSLASTPAFLFNKSGVAELLRKDAKLASRPAPSIPDPDAVEFALALMSFVFELACASVRIRGVGCDLDDCFVLFS